MRYICCIKSYFIHQYWLMSILFLLFSLYHFFPDIIHLKHILCFKKWLYDIISEWNFGQCWGMKLFSCFLFVPSEFESLFEAGRDRLSVTLSLLLNRQYRLVGPLVSLCRCSSRCDIHPVTADTTKSTSESTTGTKNAFWGQKYLIYNIPFQSKWNLQ